AASDGSLKSVATRTFLRMTIKHLAACKEQTPCHPRLAPEPADLRFRCRGVEGLPDFRQRRRPSGGTMFAFCVQEGVISHEDDADHEGCGVQRKGSNRGGGGSE